MADIDLDNQTENASLTGNEDILIREMNGGVLAWIPISLLARAMHQHTGFAATIHQHTGYAATGHTHSQYSATSHTHTAQTAAQTSVLASGFDGNLATTDDTVQKVAQKLDDLSVAAAAHSHTQYAPTSHQHTLMASDIPDLSGTYAVTGHTHTPAAQNAVGELLFTSGSLPTSSDSNIISGATWTPTTYATNNGFYVGTSPNTNGVYFPQIRPANAAIGTIVLAKVSGTTYSEAFVPWGPGATTSGDEVYGYIRFSQTQRIRIRYEESTAAAADTITLHGTGSTLPANSTVEIYLATIG